MRLQIGLIFIFLTSFNYAQSNLEPSVDSTSKLAHYTLDMMRVVQGSIQFGREWNLGKNKSLKTCILFTWAQSKGLAKPYLNAQKFTYTDEQAVKYNLNENCRNYETIGERAVKLSGIKDKVYESSNICEKNLYKLSNY